MIALLVVTIATTVGLSLIGRSTTDTAVTRNLEESARAFSAAEAGVEEALQSGAAGSGTLDSGSGTGFTTTVTAISGQANTPFTFQKKVVKEDTQTVWLVPHAADGSLTQTPAYTDPTIDVCWSAETTPPAIVATVWYKESTDGSYRTAKAAYDPDSNRALINHFSPPTATSGGCGPDTGTAYKATIRFADLSASLDPAVDTLLSLRVRPVYEGATIAVTPVAALPVQGTRVESVGRSASGLNRKIIVYRQYRAPSSAFDAAIYSENTFGK